MLRFAFVIVAAVLAWGLFPASTGTTVLVLIAILLAGVGMGAELVTATGGANRSGPPSGSRADAPRGTPGHPPDRAAGSGPAPALHRAPAGLPGQRTRYLAGPASGSRPKDRFGQEPFGQDRSDLYDQDRADPSAAVGTPGLRSDTLRLDGRSDRPPPAPPAPRGPAAPGPGYGPAEERGFPAPPLFAARPTAAHSSLWRLPARPVQPAVAADDADLGDVGVLAASIVGTGHRCAEPAEPRQDAYRIARDESGEHVVIAVADGISSCRFSDLGAAVAVSTAVNTVRRMLGEVRDPARLSAAELFESLAERMRSAADERRVGANDFGAVAIVAVVPTRKDVLDGSRRAWVGWLGDVSAWTLRSDRWHPLAGEGKAETGGVESGEIDAALPWAPRAARAELLRLPAGATVAFVTDGVGDALGNNQQVNRYLARNWARKPRLTSFLNDMSFDAQSCQDDRTAVVVWTGGP